MFNGFEFGDVREVGRRFVSGFERLVQKVNASCRIVLKTKFAIARLKLGIRSGQTGGLPHDSCRREQVVDPKMRRDRFVDQARQFFDVGNGLPIVAGLQLNSRPPQRPCGES